MARCCSSAVNTGFDQAAKILDGIERLIEAAQVGLDLFAARSPRGQLEQGRGIPARNA